MAMNADAVKMGSDYISGWKLVFQVLRMFHKNIIQNYLSVSGKSLINVKMPLIVRFPKPYGKLEINGMMTYKMNSNSYSLPTDLISIQFLKVTKILIWIHPIC